MNVWIASGRLTKDPEIRRGEKANVALFSLAVQRGYIKDGKRETDFFSCTAFGKNAEFIEKYIHKGDKVIVRGKFENDNYEKDGKKFYGFKGVIDEIDFGEPKKSDGAKETAQEGEPVQEGFMPIPENTEDFPFN